MTVFGRILGAFGLGSQVAEGGPAKVAPPIQLASAERRGYEYAIPDGGLDEYNAGGITGDDRRSQLNQLYEAYKCCPWAWAAVNAIARTITAGGLVTDFTGDDEDGSVKIPAKPPAVLALEKLLKWCNGREDLKQVLRGAIIDMLIFGDAYIEVTWFLGYPIALYSLDSPSMYPIADAHGVISGYVQVTDLQQRAEFAPNEVIHISLDSPRSGVYGISPTEAALLPITVWLFAAATVKERFRKGDPPNIHVDFPAGTSGTESNKWLSQYMTRNIGPRNIGFPIPTKGGGGVTELQQGQLDKYLSVLDQKRDEILATYGCPPAKAGVIESGNLGGGTGEEQDLTFRVNTCGPISELLLEKIVYAIVQQGFGITDWTLKFKDIDMRDSKKVEEIRDLRVRNGSWAINKYRADIGEPPIDGGDEAAIIEKTDVILVRDLESASQAGVASKLKGTALEPDEPKPGQPVSIGKPEPQPVPAALAGFAGQDPAAAAAAGAVPAAGGKNADKATAAGTAKKTDPSKKATTTAKAAETVRADLKAVDEAWVTRYRQRVNQALQEMADVA